jgi:hypothetical protein
MHMPVVACRSRLTRRTLVPVSALVAAGALFMGPVTPVTARTRCALDHRAPQGLTYRAAGSGLGKLTVSNGRDEDAVIQLVTGGRTAIAFYVRRGSIWTLDGIPDGSYALYFTHGADWSPALRRFRCPGGSWRFTRGLSYVTRYVASGRLYSHVRVTLTPAPGGNARTVPARPPALR